MKYLRKLRMKILTRLRVTTVIIVIAKYIRVPIPICFDTDAGVYRRIYIMTDNKLVPYFASKLAKIKERYDFGPFLVRSCFTEHDLINTYVDQGWTVLSTTVIDHTQVHSVFLRALMSLEETQKGGQNVIQS